MRENVKMYVQVHVRACREDLLLKFLEPLGLVTLGFFIVASTVLLDAAAFTVNTLNLFLSGRCR